MNKGIRFTDEFKRDAAAQVVERGYAVSEVAERREITTSMLYTWWHAAKEERDHHIVQAGYSRI